jgi:hypothetical protein
MNKKIICLLICTLFIATVIPTSGSIINSDDPIEDFRERNKHLNDGRLPPDPGDVDPDFSYGIYQYIQSSDPPEKTFDADEDTIIAILENIDEDLILGYLEDLVAFGPRVTGTTQCHQAGDYIYNEFESYGLEARYDDWSYGGYSGYNIEGTLQGVDEESDEIFIICAHYDSVPGSPGADDNGAGTAAVMAAAKTMSEFEFNHTIRFVAFDGEEQGLLGSHEYAEEAAANGDNIMAALNGDMIGFAPNPGDEDYIKIYENGASAWITDFCEEVRQKYFDFFDLEILVQGPAYNSDHASFWSYGYHAVMYHEYNFNDYYHSPQDLIEHMNIDYNTRVARLMIGTLGELGEAQILSEPPDKPTTPEGPDTWTINVETTFSSTTTDPEGESIFYLFDWGDGTDSGWLGPYASGQTGEASHTWTELGEYEIKVMAKDLYDAESPWSESHILTIVENEPPDAPTMTDGPSAGAPKKLLKFTFTTTDQEGNDVYYLINWGDGHFEYWDGPFNSGEEVEFGHAWGENGDFTIMVKAKDQYEAESQQSSFKIKIGKSRMITNPFLLRFLERYPNAFPILRQILGL